MQPLLSSRDNPHVRQLVQLLEQKKQREATGCFALEGARLCADALQSGVTVHRLFLTPRAAQKYEPLAALCARAHSVAWLEEGLAARIAGTKTPQGVFAVCAQLPERDIPLLPQGRYVLLDSVRDPGNMGAVLRTAEALGADGVFAGADCAELYSPKVLRASMGAVFRLRVRRCENLPAQVWALRGQGVRVYAAALMPGAVPAQDMDLSGACAVAVGNEGSGLSAAMLEACDAGVRIPMAGGAESLNAAVAAGILLWELCGPRSGRTPAQG